MYHPLKPTLNNARKLFRRSNPGIKFDVAWDRKPVRTPNGWVSSVTFTAVGYAPKSMRLYSDRDGIALF